MPLVDVLQFILDTKEQSLESSSESTFVNVDKLTAVTCTAEQDQFHPHIPHIA